MTVTADEIEAAKTAAGGWTRAQLARWGVPWPPPKGWKSRLLGEDHTNCWDRVSAGGIVEIARLALDLKSRCESPIEVMFGAHLLQVISASPTWDVVPQFKLGRFRYDFAIRIAAPQIVVLLVECDGKEFHSTPEQIANDRRKDEAAEIAGFGIIRFSGTDINREPEACALIAMDLARQLWRKREAAE